MFFVYRLYKEKKETSTYLVQQQPVAPWTPCYLASMPVVAYVADLSLSVLDLIARVQGIVQRGVL